MHIGDRHPKQFFEAVDIGYRRYQTGTMGAFAAALVAVEKERGETHTDHDISQIENDQEHKEALIHNAEIVRLALDISHGRTPPPS